MTGDGLDAPFSIDIEVRVYELDIQGHVNSAVYHQYAEHARWKYLERLGIAAGDLLAVGLGPTFLKETINYKRELRASDIVTVDCQFLFPDQAEKTFRIDQRFTKQDGSLAAHLTIVCGLLNLSTRELVADPQERLMALAINAPKNL
jgi:acyl-CoA thioester hydrolase